MQYFLAPTSPDGPLVRPPARRYHDAKAPVAGREFQMHDRELCGTGDGSSILIVEDEPAHAAAICRALQAAAPGSRTEVVGTLRACREVIASRPPDIALVDLNLPDGNAVELLTSPAGDGRFPIVVMTSFGNEQIAVHAMKAGALDYVVKSPVAFSEMPHTVERALREWSLRMERMDAEARHRALEERLRQSEKMEAIGRLAGGIAHDFNNQLAGIMGFAELLLDSLGDDSLRKYADNILKASRRAAGLTRKLLTFARKSSIVKAPTDIHAVIGEVVALLQHSIDKRIDIALHLDAQPSEIQGDPSQLPNALLNLALNARDAMPQGGLLTLATATVQRGRRTEGLDLDPGPYLRITVTDTGVGMDAETRRHLFEPFFTTKGPGEGTGLGLASVYATVRSHGGDLVVESAPGCGTTIQVFLPFGIAAPQIVAVDAAPLRFPASGRILLLDDEELVRDLAAGILRDAGYQVVTGADGEDALRRFGLAQQPFDLVILDLMMPRLGGRDTFAAMRRIDPSVRVLVVSGLPLDGEAQLVLDEGAAGFLSKPFERAELLRKVADAIAPPPALPVD
jgi:signal transduction histidine kinase